MRQKKAQIQMLDGETMAAVIDVFGRWIVPLKDSILLEGQEIDISYFGYEALQMHKVHSCSFGIRVSDRVSVGAVGTPTVFQKVCFEHF